MAWMRIPGGRFENIPSEYLETYYPLTVLEYGSRPDSGGAGFHRGGNGVHKVYRFEADGEIAIHDDRERSQPWGILGGLPGETSSKTLLRASGESISLASKISCVEVRRGDRLIYDTAGGGGWKNPLDRPVEMVQADVRRKLVSVDKARDDYGVVLSAETFAVDTAATEKLRKRIRQDRGDTGKFTFGPVPEAIGVQRREQGKSRVG